MFSKKVKSPDMSELDAKMHTMKDIIGYAASTYKDRPAIKYAVRKEVIDKSYIDVKDDSEAFSNVLTSLAMQGKHVAVIGPTSYEWIITYFGTVNSGGVIVPLDAQLPAKDLCELIDRADVEVFVFDPSFKDVAAEVAENCPKVKHIINMRPKKAVEGILDFWQLIEENRKPFDIEIDPDKMCTILFTSGTTGKPKGVMLTQRSITHNVTCVNMRNPEVKMLLSILPIHHVYCFTCDIVLGIYYGMCIAINDSIMHIARNLELFKPDLVLLVPLIINGLLKKLEEASKKLPLVPKKLIAKKGLGGNLKYIYSGGAYLDPKVVARMEKFGVGVFQGYGMSECSPRISCNLRENARADSLGQVVGNCEVKIVDEEICCRGSSVMLGYYKDPERTAETLIDGWLHTGDLGYLDEDGFLYMTGRKKNLIILENGENVSPEELENIIEREPTVAEVIIYGQHGVIIAEIFPNEEYAESKKIKDIKAEIQKAVDKINKEIPLYKRIQRVDFRDEPFEKTSSRKIIRKENTL